MIGPTNTGRVNSSTNMMLFSASKPTMPTKAAERKYLSTVMSFKRSMLSCFS